MFFQKNIYTLTLLKIHYFKEVIEIQKEERRDREREIAFLRTIFGIINAQFKKRAMKIAARYLMISCSYRLIKIFII